MELIGKIAITSIIIVGVMVSFGAYFNGLDSGAKTVIESPVVKNATISANVLSNESSASINALASTVRSVNVSHAVERDLLSPLNRIAIDKNVTDDTCAGLDSFVAKVNSNAKNGKLNASVSVNLESMAVKIESDLGCR